MDSRRVKLHPPISVSTCIALVDTALQKAKSEIQDEVSYISGVTLDLSHQKISRIPVEAISLVKDDVERLALGHNQLSSFDPEFSLCTRLRYLNIKSNLFKEFPAALCAIPSLEILDISRNKIRELPPDFGHLIGLKVLSISKNRIQVLPSYIALMEDLKILKIDHNPLVYPPREVVEFDEESDVDKEIWLDELKAFLKRHLEKGPYSQDTEDSASSDGGNDTDYSIVGKYPGKPFGNSPLNPIHPEESPNLHRPGVDVTPVLDPIPAIPSKNSQRKLSTTMTHPGPQFAHIVPPVSTGPPNPERFRSNSEGLTANRDRATKRMGYIGQKNVLGTVDEGRTVKHHIRGISYDSSINEAAQRAGGGSNGVELSISTGHDFVIGEDNQGPEIYFRRIQATPKSHQSTEGNLNITIIESARSILYSISKAQPSIETYVGLVKQRYNLQTTGIDRVLPAANLNSSSLIQALQNIETREDFNSLDVLVNASHTSILTFKHVLGQLQQVLQDPSSVIDSRYSRTLLFTIFGSLVELQTAWLGLRRYMPTPNTSRTTLVMPAIGKPKAPLPSPLSAAVAMPQAIQRAQENGLIPPTPALTVFDNPLENPDELLYEKLGSSVAATLQLISVLVEAIKKIAAQQTPQSHPSTLQKLRELDKICSTGSEVAKRLKSRLDSIRDADLADKRWFYDDITKFVVSVMDIGELLMKQSSEFGFPKQVLGGFSPVARLTKEVTVLLHSSSFRNLSDNIPSAIPSNSITTSPTSFPGAVPSHFQPLSPAQFSTVPSTPLSAVLGPAAQATVPFLAPSVRDANNNGVGEQRSNTMQSNIRTFTGVSENNFLPSVLSPRR